MTKTITRIDNPKSLYSTFVYFDSVTGEGREIHINKLDADAFQTAITNATWNQIGTLYNSSSTTVIKTL